MTFANFRKLFSIFFDAFVGFAMAKFFMGAIFYKVSVTGTLYNQGSTFTHFCFVGRFTGFCGFR